MYKVVLSHHAKERLAERIGTDKGAKHEITLRLIAALKIGVTPDADLGVRIYLPDGYQAICYPTYEGTWVVATVLAPEMVVEQREARP